MNKTRDAKDQGDDWESGAAPKTRRIHQSDSANNAEGAGRT